MAGNGWQYLWECNFVKIARVIYLKKITLARGLFKISGSSAKNTLPCFVFFVLFFFTSYRGYSQDPSFSQFTSNNLYINPAYVGRSDKIDVLIHYRRYLIRLPVKFEHMYFSADYPLSRVNGLGGVGIMVFQNSEGDGYLKTSTIGIPFSARVNISRKTSVQFGIMPSIIFKSIGWDQFIFGNQLNPYSGFDPNINSPIPTGLSESLTPLPDFSFGFLGRYVKSPSKRPNCISKVWEFGLAFHHWPLKINQSFINEYAPVPFRIVGNIKYTFPIKDAGTLLQPAVIYERQGPLSTAMIAAKVIRESYLFGFGMRLEQTRLQTFNNFTFEGGYSILWGEKNKKRAWILFSMDMPMMAKYSIANTAYEISFNYRLALEDCCGIPGNTLNYDR